MSWKDYLPVFNKPNEQSTDEDTSEEDDGPVDGETRIDEENFCKTTTREFTEYRITVEFTDGSAEVYNVIKYFDSCDKLKLKWDAEWYTVRDYNNHPNIKAKFVETATIPFDSIKTVTITELMEYVAVHQRYGDMKSMYDSSKDMWQSWFSEYDEEYEVDVWTKVEWEAEQNS